MERRELLVWTMLLCLIIATLYLIVYNFQTIFVYSQVPEDNPLYYLCSISMILLIILIILVVLLLLNLRKIKNTFK